MFDHFLLQSVLQARLVERQAVLVGLEDGSFLMEVDRLLEWLKGVKSELKTFDRLLVSYLDRALGHPDGLGQAIANRRAQSTAELVSSIEARASVWKERWPIWSVEPAHPDWVLAVALDCYLNALGWENLPSQFFENRLQEMRAKAAGKSALTPEELDEEAEWEDMEAQEFAEFNETAQGDALSNQREQEAFFEALDAAGMADRLKQLGFVAEK